MTTEAQLRQKYSGFIPPGIQVSKEPTQADIDAARALIAKVDAAKPQKRQQAQSTPNVDGA